MAGPETFVISIERWWGSQYEAYSAPARGIFGSKKPETQLTWSSFLGTFPWLKDDMVSKACRSLSFSDRSTAWYRMASLSWAHTHRQVPCTLMIDVRINALICFPPDILELSEQRQEATIHPQKRLARQDLRRLTSGLDRHVVRIRAEEHAFPQAGPQWPARAGLLFGRMCVNHLLSSFEPGVSASGVACADASSRLPVTMELTACDWIRRAHLWRNRSGGPCQGALAAFLQVLPHL